MKHLGLALLATALMCSCQKGNETEEPQAPPAASVTSVDTFASDFRITNMVASDYVVEGKNLKLENTSKNAVSYHWDFGNGQESDEKIPTSPVYYVPCGGTYTITLTAKSVRGKVSVVSKTITVLCSGRNTHNTYLDE